MADNPLTPVRVFVSYSHDDDAHREAVRDLADTLRSAHQIDAKLDQYVEHDPPRAWPDWMRREMTLARFVLCVCTPTYQRRVEGDEQHGVGRGAGWEGAIITQLLYEERSGAGVKFIPVVLHEADLDSIPYFLRGTSHHVVGAGADVSRLISQLKRVPLRPIPPLGEPRHQAEVAAPALPAVSAGRTRPFPAPGLDAPYAIQLTDDSGWDQLERHFADDPGTNHQWRHCLAVARAAGATSAIFEPQYLDADYRSEYLSLYSRLYNEYGARASRWHFFSHPTVTLPAVVDGGRYLGYCVIRPVPSARVGKTMLAPPQHLANAVLTTTQEQVSLFGHSLVVEGIPFCQTDDLYGAGCASVTPWMLHRKLHLDGAVDRRELADFFPISRYGKDVSRHTRRGMTVQEITEVMERAHLTTITRALDGGHETDEDATTSERPDHVIRRYLWAGLPVLAVSSDHIAMVSGFLQGPDLAWVVHDAAVGPYHVLEPDQLEDSSFGGPWRAIIIGLPQFVWLSPEAAEYRADQIRQLWSEPTGQTAGDVQFRARLLTEERYKQNLATRGLPPTAADRLRLSPLPRWMWVVTAIRLAEDARREPAVDMEFLFDASSTDAAPTLIAMVSRNALAQSKGSSTVSFPLHPPWLQPV